jgi:hypothetical protein
MSTVLLERAAEWSINGPRWFLYHTSCQLGSPTWVGFVTQLPHLLEVEADGIRRLANRIGGRRKLGGLLGPFLDLGLEFALRSFRRDVGEDLDVHVLEALECGTQVGRRANVLGQEIIDLVKSQVALLSPEFDETLRSFPSFFCFMLLSFIPAGLTTGRSSLTCPEYAPAANL